MSNFLEKSTGTNIRWDYLLWYTAQIVQSPIFRFLIPPLISLRSLHPLARLPHNKAESTTTDTQARPRKVSTIIYNYLVHYHSATSPFCALVSGDLPNSSTAVVEEQQGEERRWVYSRGIRAVRTPHNSGACMPARSVCVVILWKLVEVLIIYGVPVIIVWLL